MSDSKVPAESGPESPLPVVGQRRLFYFNDTGQPAYQIYDLTSEDFLNPQAGDEFFHGDVHDRSARILASMLHFHYRYSPSTSIHIKPKIIWPDASWAQPMPDVVVVNHLSEPQRQRPILDLQAEQSAGGSDGEVAIRAIFEVTSPLLAELDLETKRTLYARAAVPEYWIIDSGLRPAVEAVHFNILGYRLQANEYVPIPPSSENRWESQACRLWLTVSADHQSFQLGDLRTGKAFPMPADDDDPSISTQAEASRRAQSIADQLRLNS
jgi:Uma2 family endonuclease